MGFTGELGQEDGQGVQRSKVPQDGETIGSWPSSDTRTLMLAYILHIVFRPLGKMPFQSRGGTGVLSGPKMREPGQ